MPFVEGMALDELAKSRQGKPFSEEELRGLLERVLDALGYLHDRGIYHRDLKPGNLLITHEGIPVLIDFGSARQRLSERSMTVVESPGYTPFEQLQTRGNIGPWSDLYALGATLVKLMTGEAPPKTNDRSFGDPWRPLLDRADLAGKFSVGFLKGIDRSLKLQIEDRWQNAGEWRAVLRGETAAQPVAATPEYVPVAASSIVVSAPVTGHKKKTNIAQWAIAACMVLGLIAVGKSVSNERAKAVAQAKNAEQRAAQVERDKEAFIAQAKAEMENRSLPGSKAGEERDFVIAAGVKMAFCWIPPGEFLMGSSVDEVGRGDDEIQHRVTISKGFWLAKTEVTQAQWRAVMGSNPSHFKGDDLPVELVSWNDIASSGGFLEMANRFADGEDRFSLPTEAQWEYACRAGTTGTHSGDLDKIAWYDRNAGSKTHPVGQKKANTWGLHDMQGNVREWCADRYEPYPTGAVVAPDGANSGSYRVYRGGSWDYNAYYCRVADRDYYDPSHAYYSMGFRLVRSSVSQNGR